jgi:hypothetical protein
MKSLIKIIFCLVVCIPGIAFAESPPVENPPNPNWIFTVPVNVRNLHPDVKKIGVICETSYTLVHGWGRAKINTNGKGKVRVNVQGGSYNGNVVVPVQAGSDIPDWNEAPAAARHSATSKVDRYECKMYLINEKSEWRVPSKNNAQAWLAADPKAPFRWSTDRKNLPR